MKALYISTLFITLLSTTCLAIEVKSFSINRNASAIAILNDTNDYMLKNPQTLAPFQGAEPFQNKLPDNLGPNGRIRLLKSLPSKFSPTIFGAENDELLYYLCKIPIAPTSARFKYDVYSKGWFSDTKIGEIEIDLHYITNASMNDVNTITNGASYLLTLEQLAKWDASLSKKNVALIASTFTKKNGETTNYQKTCNVKPYNAPTIEKYILNHSINLKSSNKGDDSPYEYFYTGNLFIPAPSDQINLSTLINGE